MKSARSATANMTSSSALIMYLKFGLERTKYLQETYWAEIKEKYVRTLKIYCIETEHLPRSYGIYVCT